MRGTNIQTHCLTIFWDRLLVAWLHQSYPHTGSFWKSDELSYCSQVYKNIKKREWRYVRRTFLCAPLDLNRPTATPGKRPTGLPGARRWLRQPLWQAGVQVQRMQAVVRNTNSWFYNAKSYFGERKTSYGFLFRFFSVTRCLIFGYLFLIISIAIGCSRCFFSTFDMPDRMKYNLFPLVVI